MDMIITIIIQDPPYGSEKPWNALRLAQALSTEETQINIFLLGDGVGMAKTGQEVPSGYYNLSKMMNRLLPKERTSRPVEHAVRHGGSNTKIS